MTDADEQPGSGEDAAESPAWDAPDEHGIVAVDGPCGAHGLFRPRPGSPDDMTVVGEVWRENVYRIHDGHLKPGDVVVDLGANIGAFTVLAAKLGAAVIAVEPDIRNVWTLNENTQWNAVADQVAVVRGAAGPAARQGFLVLPDGPPSGHGKVEFTGARDGGWPVPVWALSTLFTVCQVNAGPAEGIAVLKVDIEGGEWPLLDDTSDETLRRVRYLTMEWHAPMPDGALGQLVQRLAEWFQVEMIGRPSAGGMLYATRYDQIPPDVAAPLDPGR